MSSIVDPPSDSKTGARDLRCPYCGDEISPDLEYTSMAYSEHRDLVGYECDHYACDARWDKTGRVERPSKLPADEWVRA